MQFILNAEKRISLSLKGRRKRGKMKQAIIDAAAFAAPDAVIMGDVVIHEDCNIWFHAVIRAEDAPIRIGKGSNVQDNAVVHEDAGHPVTIGEYVTIGHGAIVHGCEIGDHTLIGMGAIILNGAKIGKNCVIGAGALVTQNSEIPDGSLVIGSPARVKRAVTAEEMEHSMHNALHYVQMGKEYKEYLVS